MHDMHLVYVPLRSSLHEKNNRSIHWSCWNAHAAAICASRLFRPDQCLEPLSMHIYYFWVREGCGLFKQFRSSLQNQL